MMEENDYKTLRKVSSGLFKNALVAPLAWAIMKATEGGASFTASELRQKLGGRCADNQIREALARIEAAGAIDQLPYPGKPHPRTWERKDHPFWDFAATWIDEALARAT